MSPLGRATAVTFFAVSLAAGAARAETVYLRIGDASDPAPLERTFAAGLDRAPRSFAFAWKGTRYRAEVHGHKRPRDQEASGPTNDWTVRVFRAKERTPATEFTIQDYPAEPGPPENCGTSPNVAIDGLELVLGVSRDGAPHCEGIVAVVKKGHGA